jgi:hypothetical protein
MQCVVKEYSQEAGVNGSRKRDVASPDAEAKQRADELGVSLEVLQWV